MDTWITTAEAAQQLGVKPQTVYAYVSRGQLRSRRATDGKHSLLHPADVARLAAKGRRTARTSPQDLVIESGVTSVDADGPRYRGIGVVDLAGRLPFEAVAAWLWDADELNAVNEAALDMPWSIPPPATTPVHTAVNAMPATATHLDRLRVAVATAASADPLRASLEPSGVRHLAAQIIGTCVDALDAHTPEPARGSVAARLFRSLGGAVEGDGQHVEGGAALVDGALTLLADHELAASTLAVRVAASTRADPYAAVLVGLGVASGPLHVTASLGCEDLLTEIADQRSRGATPTDAAALVLAEHLQRGRPLSGFGHRIYTTRDPRYERLLELLNVHAPDHPVLHDVNALVDVVAGHRIRPPNIDLALAAMVRLLGLDRGAGAAIFAIARVAGWIAHAMEEYERATLIRPRAVYTGD